jgi:F-type H+-transporting ATPase subunit delta
MKNARVAQRYALALIELAEEFKLLDTIVADAGYLERLMSQSPEFARFLRSPVVNFHRKRKILAELLTGKVHDLTLRFIVLLAGKRRENHLGEVIREFYALWDLRRGVVNAEVHTVIPLTELERKSLVTRLGSNLGKTIELKPALDPSLKGGFTVRFNDTVWDASVRRRLERLRMRFAEGDAGGA